MSNIRWGKRCFYSICESIADQKKVRIAEALIPLVDELLDELIQLFPLPGGIRADLTLTPPPHVQIEGAMSLTRIDLMQSRRLQYARA
jgi:hypothetical protein